MSTSEKPYAEVQQTASMFCSVVREDFNNLVAAATLARDLIQHRHNYRVKNDRPYGIFGTPTYAGSPAETLAVATLSKLNAALGKYE